MTNRTAAQVSFVVRTPSAWTLTHVDRDEGDPVDLAGLLELVGATAHDAHSVDLTADVGADGDAAALRPGALVRSTWMWVGRIEQGRVRVRSASGVVTHLDAEDLRLIDALPGPHAALPAHELPASQERLARLALTGRFFTVEPPPAAPSDPAPSSTSDAVDSAPAPVPTAPGPVRRWVRRLRGTPPTADRLAATVPSAPTTDVSSTEVPPAEVLSVDTAVTDLGAAAVPDGRIPVYAAWPKEVGPPLALGMLTATAREWNAGELTSTYEIRRPEVAESFLEDLARRGGPAVLLCSDYVWSLEHNLDIARRAKELHSDLWIVHGGPSAPKYAQDAEDFLRVHGNLADVVVRGEGELTVCELLAALAPDGRWDPDVQRLRSVAGITCLDPETGTAVRTEDRARLADLDELPSPYLTGEFDGIEPEAWVYCLPIETNRGCPYGCTFCDWGSATMSRIRKFDIERVMAEVEWAAALGVHTITITDANFGIMSRDVEIARRIGEVRRRTGHPHSLSWTAAKNTTKHLVKIMDELVASGLTVSTSLSLQTIDPETLEVLARTNISTDHYVKLAADYRRRGFALQGDLMVGLPGQTFESYVADLQFMLDHEIMVRSWPVQMLPNAPMNDPDYRERHGIVVGEDNLVVETASFSARDRERMLRFRTVDTSLERLNVLRHVMRYLQWDHGIPATTVMLRMLEQSDRAPHEYPLLSWVVRYFDLFPTVPVGWSDYYSEAARWIEAEFGVPADDAGLRCVLALQEALMPLPGRPFPHTLQLEHDYLGYYRSATVGLYHDGHAGEPTRPLEQWGAASFTVGGDPLGLCRDGIHLEGDSRNPALQGDFHIGAAVANELQSPLLRILPLVSGEGLENPRPDVGPVEHPAPQDPSPAAVPVALTVQR